MTKNPRPAAMHQTRLSRSAAAVENFYCVPLSTCRPEPMCRWIHRALRRCNLEVLCCFGLEALHLKEVLTVPSYCTTNKSCKSEHRGGGVRCKANLERLEGTLLLFFLLLFLLFFLACDVGSVASCPSYHITYLYLYDRHPVSARHNCGRILEKYHPIQTRVIALCIPVHPCPLPLILLKSLRSTGCHPREETFSRARILSLSVLYRPRWTAEPLHLHLHLHLNPQPQHRFGNLPSDITSLRAHLPAYQLDP